jgi:ubiquinone/menaquinone biosynthesis C-methylase UbiE
MPDVWATFTQLEAETQERLAHVLETRGADPRQQEMCRAFLDEIEFPPAARVLEVGCGTGVLTRVLARVPGIESVLGVDLAPALVKRARDLAPGLSNVTFEEADARSLPLADGSFDVVVFDSTLSHVPAPERALAEAFRVLRAPGSLAVFDGDYSTATVALGDDDPLQACVRAMMDNSLTDRWVVRRLLALARACGFEDPRLRSYGYVESTDVTYMLTIVDRGVDILRAEDRIGADLATALKAEARRRVDAGAFFGHIAYASLIVWKRTDHATQMRRVWTRPASYASTTAWTRSRRPSCIRIRLTWVLTVASLM